MTEPNIGKLAKRIHGSYQGSEQEAKAILEELRTTYGRDTAVAVLKEVMRMIEFERAESDAQYRAEIQQVDDAIAIQTGLPNGTTLTEACRIKAAQGDPLAQRYLNYFNSREYRLETALTNAAVKRHPGWRHDDDDDTMIEKLDDSAPEFPELVEWFQKNFPAEAKAIEAAIDADDGK